MTFKEFVCSLFTCNKELNNTILKLRGENQQLKTDEYITNKNIEECINERQSLESELLKCQMNSNQECEPEKYWNDKYPKQDISYLNEETDGEYEIDIRNFIRRYDYMLPVISGKNNDETALNSLIWVINNITYTEDKTEYGFDEYWAMPWQTLKRKKGDCEDGSNLLQSIMLKSGIPYWKIRGTAGDTPYGGHAYTTYLLDDNSRWVVLDWCFFPNKKPVIERPDYKDEKNYGEVWFSYNEKFAFSKGLNTTKMKSNNFIKNFVIKKK